MPQSGIVAHYRLNDKAANTIVKDEMGTAATFGHGNTVDHSAIGITDQALDLDGTNDYIDTNQTFQATLRNSVTVNFWCKLDDGQPAGSVMQNFIGAADLFWTEVFAIRLIGTGVHGGKIKILLVSLPGTIERQTDDVVFSDGAQPWTMITSVFTKSPANLFSLTLYKNAVEAPHSAVTASVAGGNYTSTLNLYAGWLNNASATQYDKIAGFIDNVMIFNRAYNKDEIRILYNGGAGLEHVQTLEKRIRSIRRY